VRLSHDWRPARPCSTMRIWCPAREFTHDRTRQLSTVDRARWLAIVPPTSASGDADLAAERGYDGAVDVVLRDRVAAYSEQQLDLLAGRAVPGGGLWWKNPVPPGNGTSSSVRGYVVDGGLGWLRFEVMPVMTVSMTCWANRSVSGAWPWSNRW
jgi:hypothetical protein